MADSSLSIAKTLVNEGGFQRNSNDRRNWSSGQIGVGALMGTKYGITSQDMPGVDISNLSVQQAQAFYSDPSKGFWHPLYANINAQLICDKLFDMGVLFGVATVVRVLQKALDLPVDGNFGPMTLQAVNNADASTLWTVYTGLLIQRDELIVAGHPEDAQFEAGWTARVVRP